MPKTGTIERSEETKPMEQNLARQARPRGYLAVAKPMAVGVAGVYRHLFVCSTVRGQLAVVRWPDFFDRLGWIRNF